MPQIDLVQLLIQTGFAGMFVWLLIDTRAESRKREERMQTEAAGREARLVAEACERERRIQQEAMDRERRIQEEAKAREERLLAIIDAYATRLEEMAGVLQELRDALK